MAATPGACSFAGASTHHDGEDVRPVVLKVPNPGGPNRYGGPPVLVCAGCRRARNGGFRFWRLSDER